jgi:hypothetical protein
MMTIMIMMITMMIMIVILAMVLDLSVNILYTVVKHGKQQTKRLFRFYSTNVHFYFLLFNTYISLKMNNIKLKDVFM